MLQQKWKQKCSHVGSSTYNLGIESSLSLPLTYLFSGFLSEIGTYFPRLHWFPLIILSLSPQVGGSSPAVAEVTFQVQCPKKKDKYARRKRKYNRKEKKNSMDNPVCKSTDLKLHFRVLCQKDNEKYIRKESLQANGQLSMLVN